MDIDGFLKKELLAEDYQTLLPYFHLRESHICENVLISHYMWMDFYHTQYLRDAGGLIWVMTDHNGFSTLMPLCKKEDLPHYFHLAEQYFNETLGTKMSCYLADKEALEILNLDPAKYEIRAQREYFDYIYDAEKFRTYAGRAFHKKKNHVNAFLKQYEGRFACEQFDCGTDRAGIMDFLRRWETERGIVDDYNRIDFELNGIRFLLDHCELLDFHMGGILIGGRLEAFSLGAYNPAEKTAYIHAEKANPEIRGLYPFMRQQFVLHEFPEALEINCEDDMGLEGLRKSKMSYNPIRLVEKYEIHQK